MIDELLFQTRTCPLCNGEPIASLEKDGEVDCPKCRGVGVQIDNAMPEIIKRYCPDISRHNFVKILSELMSELCAKLKDAYDRGVREGKIRDEKKEATCQSLDNRM